MLLGKVLDMGEAAGEIDGVASVAAGVFAKPETRMRSRLPFVAGSCRSATIVTVIAGFWVLIGACPAFALDPTLAFRDSIQTHFEPGGAEEEIPSGIVDSLEQTRDGFLWMIVNRNGLTRYDGRRFHLFEGRTNTIAAAPNGDLWLGTAKELLRFPADRLIEQDLSGAISFHPGPGAASNIQTLHFDREGVLWVGTEDGLFRYDDGRFSPVGPRTSVREIEPAGNGHLLLVTANGPLELDPSQVVQSLRPSPEFGVKAEDIFHVLEDSRGDRWYCSSHGVLRFSGASGRKLPPYGPTGHGAYKAYEDRQGNVWVAEVEGLFRATAAGLELVAPKMAVRSMFSDRDGALWVGTNGDGLYRFRDRAVRMFTTADGLPNDVIMTVLAGHDGSIWTGANCGGVSRFDGAHFRAYAEKDGLLNSCVWALAEDAHHDLWIGTYGGGLFRLHEGRFAQFLPGEIVSGIAVAKDDSLWLATPNGVAHLKDGHVRRYTTADGLSGNAIRGIYCDHSGKIFAGCNGGLDLLVGDRFECAPAIPKAAAAPIGEDRSGALFIEFGQQLFAFRVAKDRVDEIAELAHETGMVETRSGEMWFGGMNFFRVPPGAFDRARARDEPLNDELFTTADGLPPTEASSGAPNMTLAGDGVVWIATPRGLAKIDSQRLGRTDRPPDIFMYDVTVGRETRPAPRTLDLPPGTSHIELDFSPVEVVSPEKIHMQYRMDGVDSEWLDAGPSPRATYSSLPAGTHSFRIRACSRNGIWDRAGIVYVVHQKPYFYQTGWFMAAMVGVVALLAGLGHRVRVGQVSRRMSALFDERLAERTRVAHEFHDTLLQTVQGSKMIADHALEESADHARLVRAVEKLSRWLEQATREGRASLNSLRASTTENYDLGEALRQAIDECCAERSIEASFSGDGTSRELHPVVRNEIYRIGYEAIRNACAHSGCTRLEVALECAHDLTLRVNDNGVGIDAATLEAGKEGHFGLHGMRERAERSGAKLTITSAPGSGTLVTVIVPGRIAYRTRRRHASQRINRT